ncbi:MAG TPA: AraC family transcriptional regulator [Shinella sp.]|jgi:AraC-like DNA-binding protein|uniref:helix-turn-helix domain-containing protein n=1 Tax=Shinella sp. TaxID=1870904 RepID=UPI002E163D29|nr:AraC family transcriptional regulator [Shinella sp.]
MFLNGRQKQEPSVRLVENLFAVAPGTTSHLVSTAPIRFDVRSDREAGGQLVCCQSGELELSGPSGQWLIPADHMVFIPKDRPFRIWSKVPTSLVVVKFCRDEVPWQHSGCWVGRISDFTARMLEYGQRWNAETDGADHLAASFFVTLGAMLPGWFNHERIMWTPYAKSTAVQRIVDLVLERGPNFSVTEAAEHVGMSERTLRRHLQAEIGQNWREFIREIRMNRAMELLRNSRESVTSTAFTLGFASSSAFTHAFSEYVGKTPSAYAKSFERSGTLLAAR